MLSRRRLLLGAGLGGIAALAAGCRPGPVASEVPSTRTPTLTPTESPVITAPPATPQPTPSADPAALRRKIGGLLVVGFRGLEVGEDDPVVRAIADDGLGGVVLFDRDQQTGGSRNVASPSQVEELVGSLRARSRDGLFVAIDQEGGRVARLTPAHGFPATVSQADLGRDGDADAALAAGRATAVTLRSAGIDWNFAPVVDLNINPDNPSIGALDRSFSADPDVVVELAGAIVRAHRESGVLTTLKHFPGLGSATGDTDRDFVDVTRTWSPIELEPFRRLHDAGLADSVMVANAMNGQIDAGLPASLSAKTVSGSLRDDLGWDGLVVTDDLQAGAIRGLYSHAEAVDLAIAAGCDVLLFANQQGYEPDVAARTIDVILDLFDRGRVTEARIDASLARIAAARASLAG